MKTCPECAEEVREAARICRYCGHRFIDGEMGETRGRDIALRRRRAWWSIVAGAVAALMVGVLLEGSEDHERPTGSAESVSSTPAPTTSEDEAVEEPVSSAASEGWRPEPAPEASGEEPVRCDIEKGCYQGDTPVPQVVQGDPCTTAAGDEGAWYGPGGDVLRCVATPGELDPSQPVLCEYRDCYQDGKRIPALDFYEGMECDVNAEWTLVEEGGDTETFECRAVS